MKVSLFSVVACSVLALSTINIPVFGVQGTAAAAKSSAAAGKTSTAAQSSAAAAKGMPSDAEIADAKAKGMVWVNMDSKIYHKPDAAYGKTKKGQFMTEADAQKAGARLAKATPGGKKAKT